MYNSPFAGVSLFSGFTEKGKGLKMANFPITINNGSELSVVFEFSVFGRFNSSWWRGSTDKRNGYQLIVV
jgi:hypothetical protein